MSGFSQSTPLEHEKIRNCHLRGGGDKTDKGKGPHRKVRRRRHSARAEQDSGHPRREPKPKGADDQSPGKTGPENTLDTPDKIGSPSVYQQPQAPRSASFILDDLSEPRETLRRSERIRLPVRDWPIGRNHSGPQWPPIERLSPTVSETESQRSTHTRSTTDRQAPNVRDPDEISRAPATELKAKSPAASGGNIGSSTASESKAKTPVAPGKKVAVSTASKSKAKSPVASGKRVGSSAASVQTVIPAASSSKSKSRTSSQARQSEEPKPCTALILPNWGST